MMHGMLWTSIGAAFTFIGMWMAHEPDAIASLSSIYYDPSAATVQNAAYGAASGGILMLLIGAGLHINGRLSGAGLASDTNAVLVSYAFSMSLFLGFVSDHTDSSWGDLLCSQLQVSFPSWSCSPILANHLLTLGRRTNDTVMPSQWLIIGGLALPLIMCAADFVLDLHDAVLESMAILPMLASGLAVALMWLHSPQELLFGVVLLPVLQY